MQRLVIFALGKRTLETRGGELTAGIFGIGWGHPAPSTPPWQVGQQYLPVNPYPHVIFFLHRGHQSFTPFGTSSPRSLLQVAHLNTASVCWLAGSLDSWDSASVVLYRTLQRQLGWPGMVSCPLWNGSPILIQP